MVAWFNELFPQAQPLQGFLGGLLIGLSGTVMLLGAGRIAGISGLAARAAGLSQGAPRLLAVLFIAGLPTGAAIMIPLTGEITSRFPPSAAVLIVAGLITGFGTRLGSGCTSGHGVCGMGRLSPRSIVATMTFIGTGMITVALANAFGGAW